MSLSRVLARAARIHILQLRWKILRWQLRAEGTTAESVDKLQHQIILQLRALLIATPYWANGHLHLAEASLKANDLHTAFISTEAVLALDPQGECADRAKMVRARCFLKRGEAVVAHQILTELLKKRGNSWELREDLAAALILEKSFEAALRELESIPPHELTPEGHSALSYVRGKVGASPS